MYGKGFLYNDPLKLVEVKDWKSVNKEILKGINIVSVHSDNIVPFGSWTYKSQLYPGDVDLIEVEEKCCSLDSALNIFTKYVQKVVKNILKNKKYYLADIKAGFDYVYKLDSLGSLTFDSKGKAIIRDFDKNKFLVEIKQLYMNKLLSRSETTKLLKLGKLKINQKSFEEIYKMLREKWLLRWSAQEILKGKKVLIGGRIKKLKDAINEPTLTKVDMITMINGKFIEFSNVFVFYLVDKKGERKLLNFTDDLRPLSFQLKQDIQKLAFSDHKYFKMVKRMWSLARISGDYKMIKILTPLMQTDLGRLSQIVSELDTLGLLLEYIKSPPFPSIAQQVDGFKYRLESIYEIDLPRDDLFRYIDNLGKHMKNTKSNKSYLIKHLGNLKKYLHEILASTTLQQLKKLKIWPLPKSYLPKK